MDDDWDLQAVVRGCSAITTTTSTTATPTITTTTATSTSSFDVGFHSLISSFQPPPPQVQEEDKLFCFQDLFEPKNESTTTTIEELHDLYKPFFPKPSPTTHPLSPQSAPVSPLSVLGAFQDLSSSQQQQPQHHVQQKQHQVQQKQQHVQLQQPLILQSQHLHQPKKHASSGSNGTTTQTQIPRSKRRKNQMKRVCQVPAEGLSSDMWSWRKYGQKPIKGSPYPRGYYKCSTSKGCLARKQVERNRSDPNMFIVTYTAEHNHPMPTHRNSLAGCTRQKQATSGDPNKPTSSQPASPATSLSPATEKLETSRDEKEEIVEEDDDDFSVSDMPLDDDFFAGLGEELPGSGLGPAHDDCFSDHFPATTQFPWLSNSAATTAAGGG